MTDTQFVAFIVAITLLTISPGVDTLLVLRNTSRGGWKDGVVSSLGICSGLFVHATVSAVGISVILLQSAWAFGLLKLAGALYLVWLGIQSLRSLGTSPLEGVVPVKSIGFNGLRSIREGLLSNVLNPKPIVFYMAFLPQFVSPDGNLLLQSLSLAGIHFMIGMLWLSALTLLLYRIKEWGAGERVEKVLQGITGAVMVILGVSMALTKNE
ncbi:LysE family translocator [Neptunomonas qingdaonensis]|uniref:Threonine/homoserine/homoserine lactone efflux protein n=1 Tax=Neptunomonas qingdaonensis TaxID=1045558 RepID=A0A1I2W0P5_9GAMM|nr:LysE family translocator [Neptunomonas qingdaonensis]SFG95005.1 Threonine/homoserine/homoserine lactone efflux protein [Neptunomonas qingdaonensis]